MLVLTMTVLQLIKSTDNNINSLSIESSNFDLSTIRINIKIEANYKVKEKQGFHH